MKLGTIAAAMTMAALTLPSQALAVDTFVEPDTGSDANNCTQATPGGAGVGPCQTVAGGVAKAAPGGGTVRVDRGDAYAGNVNLFDGVSVVGQELDAPVDTGAALIDGGVGTALIIASLDNAGTIQGLRLHGDIAGVSADGTVALIAQNTFDDPAAMARGVTGAHGSVQITGNTFTGNGTGAQVAVGVGNGSVRVTGNTITGYWIGIIGGGTSTTTPTSTPTISGNSITGTHQTGMQGGAGMFITESSNPLIEGNSVTDPGTGVSSAITINGNSDPATTGATLRRNRVVGHHTGISISDVALPTSSTSDVVTGATNAGIEVRDQPPTAEPIVGDMTLTNGTFWGNAIDVRTFDNTLTVDSTIVEDPIDDFTATCAISFSRGPTTSGGTCDTFQTTADPQFVNAPASNFHLLPGSPMINAGNPAPPPPGALDFDGEARALAYSICGAPLQDRRDIGADETPPNIPNASCPPSPGGNPPTVTKKCKKGQKLKKGKCVKKRRKRKKK